MAYSAASTGVNTSGSSANDSGLTVSVGDTIVGMVRIGTSTATSISDDLGNSYTKVQAQLNATSDELSVWVCNVTSGGSPTQTINQGGSATIRAQFFKFTGRHTTAPVGTDKASATGTSTTPTVSLTVSTADSDIFGAADTSSVVTFTAGGAYTLRGVVPTPNGNQRVAGESADAVGAGTPTVDFTIDPSRNWSIVALALKPAGGAAPVTGTGNVGVALTPSGNALRGNLGTGSSAVALTLSGTGKQLVSGSGNVAVAPTLSGTGRQVITGSGSVPVALTLAGSQPSSSIAGSGGVVVSLSLSGTGRQTHVASGGITVPSPTLSGTGLVGSIGIGGVTITALSLAGAGTVLTPITGSGDIALSLLLAGSAATTDSVVRNGRYAAEHRSAVAAIKSATGHAAAHRAALLALKKAGGG